MDYNLLTRAFDLVGQRLDVATYVVVGGSAALLLHRRLDREANDCDLAAISPASEEENLLEVANQVAEHEPGLEAGWLNAHLAAWADTYPKNWEARVVELGVYGNLQVHLMSPPDCVSMLALRLLRGDPDRDLNDVDVVDLSVDEEDVVRKHLEHLESGEWKEGVLRVRTALRIW